MVKSGFPPEREPRPIEESMPGHGWRADPNGKFVYVSPKTLNFIGPPAENPGRIEGTDDCGWWQVVHTDDYDRGRGDVAPQSEDRRAL